MGIDLGKMAETRSDSWLCLELSHGRKKPEQDMTGWGKNGPILGPFPSIHVEYRGDLRIVLQGDKETCISIDDDLIYYDGMYYGNWVIVSVASLSPRQRKRVVPFSAECNRIPRDEQKRVAALKWYVYHAHSAGFCTVSKSVYGRKPVCGPLDKPVAELMLAAMLFQQEQDERLRERRKHEDPQ